MKRVVLVSGHYFDSRRKAGFHWLAEAYWRAGWDVTFITASISHLSRLRRDYRFEYPIRQEANRLKPLRERLASYVLFTAVHPANLRLRPLNWLSAPLFKRYGRSLPGTLEPAVLGANVIIFESTPGLMLLRQFKAMNPGARYVYRVSDDLRLLKSHPAVLRAEQALASGFDLISVPMHRMRGIFPETIDVSVDPHGLQKELFDRPSPSPYAANPGAHVVFAGNSHFDYEFIARAAVVRPAVNFHIIGPIPNVPAFPNVLVYGEMSFAETIPYLQHADAGLQIRSYSPGAESLADSLKVQQYSYCGLGIVAPGFLTSTRPNVFTYMPGDTASIAKAIDAAVTCTANGFLATEIPSWDELAARLAA